MDGTKLALESGMLSVGEVVGGRFMILDCVASGGMGTVYRAHDAITGDDVALKILKPGHDGWRFTRETRIASRVEHPCIVGYLAHGVTALGVPYLALEWLDGEDLESRLARGPLSLLESLQIARRIARALRHLHDEGVVHRDVKPANIFLCEGRADRCRLLDFGVARVLGAETAPEAERTFSGVVVGTPLYMAPEQALGAPLTPRTDIHALGNVLFECLTGRAPFDAPTLPGTLLRIIGDVAPTLTASGVDAPAEVEELCQLLLAKDPNARPDAAAACFELERLIHQALPPRSRRRPSLTQQALDWVERTIVSR